jgi:Uma2 family endonuclease
MLRTQPHTPWLSHTPRKVKCADGRTRNVPRSMTLAEFGAFPWPDGQRWELLWGVPVMSPAPQPPHQSLLLAIASFLYDALEGRQKTHVLPGVDILLPDADSYVCPDISVIEVENDENAMRGPLEIIPLLVVENLSPSTGGNDLGSKREAYEESKIPEYWVANPANGSVTIFVFDDGEYQEVASDKDGYVRSPLLSRRIRIRRAGLSFRIETAA